MKIVEWYPLLGWIYRSFRSHFPALITPQQALARKWYSQWFTEGASIIAISASNPGSSEPMRHSADMARAATVVVPMMTSCGVIF